MILFHPLATLDSYEEYFAVFYVPKTDRGLIFSKLSDFLRFLPSISGGLNVRG